MTEQITGTVDNGGRATADFSFYKGPVGTRTRAGSDLIEVAYRGDIAMPRLPAKGTLNGDAVEVLSLKRSEIDRQLMLATVRPVTE